MNFEIIHMKQEVSSEKTRKTQDLVITDTVGC